MSDDHKNCLVCKHPAPCANKTIANSTCVYLADGMKVVVCRDSTTNGRAWLEVQPQARVVLGGGDGLLAPDPPHDPLGLEMCPGITPPQEDTFDWASDLKRVVDDIKDGKNPDVSPEMMALAEEACKSREHHATDTSWAKRLAGELVEAAYARREDKSTRRWVKVQRRNEWQHDVYFYLDGDKERHLSGGGALGVLGSVAVRWPDGLADKLNVSVTSEWRRVYEQGPGSYAVQSPVMEVGVVLHGVTVYINLAEFEIDPDSCEWEKTDE